MSKVLNRREKSNDQFDKLSGSTETIPLQNNGQQAEQQENSFIKIIFWVSFMFHDTNLT